MDADPTVDNLIELPRRVVKQPTPEIHSGGDCGACVLAGLLGMSIEDVYAKLGPKNTDGSPRSFDHTNMEEALRRAFYDLKLIDRYVTKTPMWPTWDGLRAWGDPSWTQSMNWQDWLRMAFDAGYYALAMVRAVHEPMMFETNHWVMYCGLRTKWEHPRGTAPNTGRRELLVSDSGRTKPHEAWFEVGPHLKERGGFAVLLARPRQAVVQE